MKKNQISVLATAAFTLLFGIQSCKPKNAGNAVSADAASKAYVAPGKYDSYYNFVSKILRHPLT